MKNKIFNGKMYITIDTEMDADIHWKKAYPPQFSSVLEGIPQFLRPIWDEYNVHPIYFVSPEVAESKECCKVLKDEVNKGAVIGAHLHPEYIEPYKKDMSKQSAAEFPCYAYNKEIEKQKLQNLTNMIFTNIGIKPIWYRAARFGADADTMRVLEELGYQYDSSLTPYINWSDRGGPDHSKTPLSPYYIDFKDIYRKKGNKSSIIEYPVTIMGKRWGVLGSVLPNNWLFYKWLRPSHMTFLEQKYMIKKLREHNVQNIVMMFHSMEVMIRKTPYVRTKWMQTYYLWRLKKTIQYARNNGYSM